MAVANAEERIPFRDSGPGKIYSSRLKSEIRPILPEADTLSKNFLLRVKELGDEVAQRKKRFGIWQEYTWNEVYSHVVNFGMGLIKLGLQRGNTLVIIGENDPEMYWSQIAAHALHCMTCCVFSDASPQDILYVINSTDATFVCARDQEQVDKLLEIRETIPQILKVVYWEERGMWAYADEWLASYSAIQAIGADFRQQEPGMFDTLARSTDTLDTIILSMTSGTTSLPKFAEVTHYQVVYGHA